MGGIPKFLADLFSSGRQGCFAKSYLDKSKKLAYQPVERELTESDFLGHFNQGPYLGVYLMNPGITTSLLCIDLDDKSGEVGEEKMRELAVRIAKSATGTKPVIELSGGGKGYHVWWRFKQPEPAAKVRSYAVQLLEKENLKEGTGGVAQQQAEIYPTMEKLDEGKKGNLVAAPFNRASKVMSLDYDRWAENHVVLAAKFPVSELHHDWEGSKEKKEKPKAKQLKAKKRDAREEFTKNDLVDALEFVPNDDLDYDTWRNIGYAIYDYYEGDDQGYKVFVEWSSTSDKHDESECKKLWSHTKGKDDEAKIGAGTLFKIAQKNGWVRFTDIHHDFCWVSDQKRMFNIHTLRNHDREGFDALFMHRHPKLSSELLSRDNFIKVDTLTYAPGQEKIIISDPMQDGSCLNAWKDDGVKPAKGNPDLFLEHMRNLIPNQVERDHVLDVFASLVQKPLERVRHAILIQGSQGIGKNMIGDTLRGIVGSSNYGEVDARDIDSDFTDWLENKRLIVIDEIMAGGRWQFNNNMKSKITSDKVNINKKHVAPYSVPNRALILMFTNHEDAIPIEEDDRRYFVVHSPMKRKPDQYYVRYYTWLEKESGAAAVYRYLLERDIAHFNPNAPAPETEAKRSMQSYSKSETQSQIEHLLASEVGPWSNDLIPFTAVRDALRDNPKHTNQTIHRALVKMGCVRVMAGVKIDVPGSPRVTGDIWAIKNSEDWENRSEEEIVSYIQANLGKGSRNSGGGSGTGGGAVPF